MAEKTRQISSIYLDKLHEFYIRYSTEAECWMVTNMDTGSKTPIEGDGVDALMAADLLEDITDSIEPKDLHYLEEVAQMSHQEMAQKWRFEKSGSPYFVADSPIYSVFERRFNELGRFNATLSKKIGWDRHEGDS